MIEIKFKMSFLQQQFHKTRAWKIFVSAIARSKASCSVSPLLFETTVGESRQNYVYFMKKQGFHHCSHNFNQQKLKMKVSVPTSIPISVNLESKKWNRTVTIKQCSKNDENKLLTFDISVLDTYPDDLEQNRSTIVAVHGFPGSGNDFELLAAKLHEKGIRVIAPTSLGMTDSPITIDHLNEVDFSTDGRTRTLQLILKEMNINRIDMLISHSAGAWTMYKFGATWENIGSLFGINPGGAEPNRIIRPFLLMRFIADALLWPLGRLIITPFLAKVYNLIGFRDVTKNGTGLDLIATQQYITNQGFSDVPLFAKTIRNRCLPVLFAHALNDKIVEPKIFFNMAYNVLGIPTQNTITYTDDKTPNRDPFFVPDGWLTRCLVFARGGHIVHLAHANEIAEQIENLLKYISTVKRNTLSDTGSAV